MSYEGGSDSSETREDSESTTESGCVDAGEASATDDLMESDDISSSEASDELMEDTGTEADRNTEPEEQLAKAEDSDKTASLETADEKIASEAEKNSEQNENSEKDEEAIREEINEKSNYSDEVNDSIKSVEELEVYQKAGLREENIDGKTALVRDDIDWDQKDEFGRTNRERVEEDELVPYNKSGEKVELHHIGQKDDSPLAELTTSEHRGKGNDTVLHDKTKESEIDRPAFTETRITHWKERAKK